MATVIETIEAKFIRKDIPDFDIGDTVSIGVKFVEGDKEKFHEFKGVVIARKGRSSHETVTVRKMSFGVGVERIFYVNSPNLRSFKVIKKGKVRRAKLYYLRDKIGKKARVKDLKILAEAGLRPTEGKPSDERLAQKSPESNEQ